MNTDPIADLLTRIRNAMMARHPVTKIPASIMSERILQVLVDEGYIDSFSREEDQSTVKKKHGKPVIKIFLRYTDSGEPVVRELNRMSRPGKRLYVGKDDIPRYKSGLGVVVVSTSLGVLSDREARKRGVGGEPLCSIF